MNIEMLTGKYLKLAGHIKQNIALVINNDRMYEKGVKECMFAVIKINESRINIPSQLSHLSKLLK